MSSDWNDDLFGSHTRARKDDPATSKAAAARIMPTLTDKQRAVMEVFKQERHRRGLTQFELEEICGWHGSTWRTRVSELGMMGLLVQVGTRRISRSHDPRAEREIWFWHEYVDPTLANPLPEPPPAPLPPTNAHYDEARRLIHNQCAVCGEDAPFGTGVNLLKDHLGTWYCLKHWPNNPNKTSQSPTP